VAAPEPDRWREIGPYLDRALELDDEERHRFLSSLHERDPNLADDVRGLIDEHRVLSVEGFLERRPARPLAEARAGQRVGPYTLRSLIGSGGMGAVWLATRSDGRFERTVAVKFLNVALAGQGEERFRREGQLLALLSHPNVAQLIDAGMSAAGQPYLVLEHVEGMSIDRFCVERALDVSARVRLFLDVLDAIAHAHATLIVHRDLKPSNVLVTADGRVKLLDFGIARLVEVDGTATALTSEGICALTPQYAAPEQVTGGAITTATDVYALGILLYVLLTGRHPAGAAVQSPAALIAAIVDGQPPRPSDVAGDPRTRRALRGDLDTIVLRALKKRPAERYGSVTAFAGDVRRHLAHEPISARPDTLAYRAARFVRRNRTATVLASLAALATIAGIVGTAIQARTARAERDFAVRQLARAEAINDLNAFLLSDAAPLGRPFTVNDLLARAERIVSRQQDKHDPSRIEILVSIGAQYWTQDEDASARRVLAAAYADSRAIADRSVRAKASCALAGVEARGTDLARAETLIQEGLGELGTDPPFALERAFCLMRGSFVAGGAGDSEAAIARATEARRLLDDAPAASDLLRMRALAELAEAYRVAGRNREAAATFAELFPRLEALGRDDTQTAGTWLNNWGLALWGMGRPLEAERVFRRGIEVSRAGRDVEGVSPMLLTNYARVLRDLARLTEGAAFAERAHETARKAGDQVVLHQSLLLRAWIYTEQREFARARAMLDEAAPALRERFPAGHVALAALLSYEALLEHGRGHLERALRLATEALESVEATVRAGGQGVDFVPVLLVRRSAIALDMARAGQAAADAHRAIELLDAAYPAGTLTSDHGRAWLALGRARRAQRLTDEAAAAMREAARHLRDSLGPDHPHTLEAQRQ
jgi:serine/threonine-protein kinase